MATVDSLRNRVSQQPVDETGEPVVTDRRGRTGSKAVGGGPTYAEKVEAEEAKNPTRRYSDMGVAEAAAVSGADTANVLGNSALFGLPNALIGVVEGSVNARNQLFKLGESDDPVLTQLGEAYKEGYQKPWQWTDEAKARLNDTMYGYGDEVSEVAGAVMPGGLAARIDQGLHMLRPATNALGAKASQYFKYMLTGGAAEATEGTLRGDDPNDIALQATVGAVAAPIAQAIMGDFAAPIMQRLRDPATAGDRAIIEGMRNTGGSAGGMSVDQMEAAFQNLRPGQNILDLEVPDRPVAEATKRFHDTLAGITFPKVSFMRQGTNYKHDEYLNRYTQALTQTAAQADQAARVIQRQFDTALGEPRSVQQVATDSQSAAEGAVFILSSLRQTDPMPDGSMPLGSIIIDSQRIVDDVGRQLSSSSGRSQQGVTGLNPDETWAYNTFKDLLRGVELEDIAKGVRKIPVDNKLPDARIPDIFPEIPLSKLDDARRQFAAILSPGSGVAVTPERKAALTKTLKYIDDELSERTMNLSGEARSDYAAAMQISDAYEAGRQVYGKTVAPRGTPEEIAIYNSKASQDIDQYKKSLQGNPAALEAFSEGFASAQREGMGSNGFMNEMNMLMGTYGPAPDSSLARFHQKEGNIDVMRKVYGDDKVDDMLAALNNVDTLAAYRDRLARMFKARGVRNDAVVELIENAGPMLNGPKSRGPMVISAAEAVLEHLYKGDPSTLNSAIHFLTDPTEEVTRRGVNAVRSASRGPTDIGNRSAQAAEGAGLWDYIMGTED